MDSRLKERLEELSSDLVLALPEKLGVDGVAARFAEIAFLVRRAGNEVGSRIAELTEALFGRGDLAPEALIENLSRSVTALQHLYRDGRDAADVLRWFERLTDAGALAAKPPDSRDAEPLEETIVLYEGDHEILREFIAESSERLDWVEAAVLALEQDGTSRESLNTAFRGFHTIKGVAAHLDLFDLEELSHETENILQGVRDGELSWNESLGALVLASCDTARRLLESISTAIATDGKLGRDPSVPVLVKRLAGARQETDYDEDGSRVGSRDSPPASRGAAPSGSENRHTRRDSIRIDSDRLDHLLESVRELLAAVSVLERQIASDLNDAAELALNGVRSAARELQELGYSLRMVSLESLYRRMTRIVHDLSRDAGKRVRFLSSGALLEIDKSMVDRLADPLVHLLRNAVGHGIEREGDRRAAGKPPQGTVALRSYQRAGSVFIEVEDDGGGLDHERILEKARALNLVGDDESPSSSSILNLVFEPGLSTADTVSAVSGRGVGMDVVKRCVESLRGSIEITSDTGVGTRFTIRLPLTVADVDGMVARGDRGRARR